MIGRDILLIGGGIAIGYLIFKKDLFKRTEKATKDIVSGVTTGVTEAIDPKKAECEKKWVDKIGSVTRFASSEAMESSKSNFVKECMLTK